MPTATRLCECRTWTQNRQNRKPKSTLNLMRFDPSGLYAALDKMNDNAKTQGRDLVDVLAQGFLKDIKAEGREIAPTPEELVATAKKLKWRLKRKPGVTPAKELSRRIRAKGTFAREWKRWKEERYAGGFRIWLVDMAGDSDKVDKKKGVSDRAEKITGRKFKSKLNTLADRLTSNF